jgi:hypothetical protein
MTPSDAIGMVEFPMSQIADPRFLLRDQIGSAMADTTKAMDTYHQGEDMARFRLGNPRYENIFAILTAVRAVEHYKAFADRRIAIKMHRTSQRTADRRSRNPVKRRLRRPDEWDGPSRIPQLTADELSTKHADEALSLMWLAYFHLEAKQSYDRKALKFFEASLPTLYRRPTNFGRVQEALRKRMASRAHRSPPAEMCAFYNIAADNPDATKRVALEVFQKWKDGINEVRFGSGRPKSKRVST